MRLTVALAFLIVLPSCGADTGRANGESCEFDGVCASGLCGAQICLDPAGDRDEDSLTNELEVRLGTSPLLADTDGDGVSDPDELGDGAEPIDGDGDGLIDAIESGNTDADGDCLDDEDDPFDGIANKQASGYPNACGDGAYQGMGACALLEVALRGTCASAFGEAFACFDPVGECVLTQDGPIATAVYDNGAVHHLDGSGPSGAIFVASDGTRCLERDADGLRVGSESFLAFTGAITCPSGETVELEPDLRQLTNFCFQNGNGCATTE